MRSIRSDNPTRDELSAALGIRVPDAFVRLVAAIAECLRMPITDDDLLNHLGWLPAGPLATLLYGDHEHRRKDPAYSSTPPEMVAFGSTGVDGDHHGYVIHAPELALEDYPFGNFCPMDFGWGFQSWGSSTPIAIERGLVNSWEQRGGLNSGILQVFLEALGITPDVDNPPSVPDARAHWQGAWLDSTPAGYRFVPTHDGIGALAPAHLFGGQDPEPYLPHQAWHVDAMVHARAGIRAFRAGFFGSALLHLKEAIPSPDDVVDAEALAALVATYHALGRSSVADRLLERHHRAP